MDLYKSFQIRYRQENDFLPYKPSAPHSVASAPLKALMCFCLSPLLDEKDKPPALRVVVGLRTLLLIEPSHCIKV
jgi:hypothetical protein